MIPLPPEGLNETSIARLLALYTFSRKCVVLVPNCNWTGHECDLLCVTTDLRIIDCEIKISRSDLKADRDKEKWWHSEWDYGLKRTTERQWPPKVWKHYYVMPAAVWDESLIAAIPACSGVIALVDERIHLDGPARIIPVVKRRAKPNREAYRLTPAQAVDVARLANLRQWSAIEAVRNLLKDYKDMQATVAGVTA